MHFMVTCVFQPEKRSKCYSSKQQNHVVQTGEKDATNNRFFLFSGYGQSF